MASNVIPFKPRPANIGYAPGVTPFDESNPLHVRAWNSFFRLGQAQQRAQKTEA